MYGVNDAGLAVGTGLDPNDAARNVGFVYDIDTDTAFEVDALPGLNGALNFAVSNAGHVVGSAMLFQGASVPFIWTEAGGSQAVPLPLDTSQGGARGVNSDGWVVGTASNAYAIPFLYDGETTYRMADLLPADSGWDLDTNTFSSAHGHQRLRDHRGHRCLRRGYPGLCSGSRRCRGRAVAELLGRRARRGY